MLQSRPQTVPLSSPLGVDLDGDELTQQVVTPLAADDAVDDEPTLVGLDFDELYKLAKHCKK